MPGPAPAREFVAVTINIHGVHGRTLQRTGILTKGLAALNADVVFAQEVTTYAFQGRELARWLSRETGSSYRAIHVRKRGWRGIFEGICVITRLPVSGQGKLDLGHGWRVAQSMFAEVDGARILLANTHLSHRSHDEDGRRGQAQRLRTWLDERSSGDRVPVLLGGDFNALPGSEAVRALEVRYRSAYKAVHGTEPRGTAPSDYPERTIDYLFAGDGLEVLDAGLCFDAPVDGRWASDHVGVWGRFRVAGV